MKRSLRTLLLMTLVATGSPRPTQADGLTPAQRRLADAVVGSRITEVRDQIARDSNLEASITALSQRKSAWRAWEPAAHVGWCVRRCKEAKVPVPSSINTRVIDDIIWQYDNAYGSSNPDRREHREECARALGFIGDPRGVPTIVESLRQQGGSMSWQALEGISDARFIEAIEKYLDFSRQQDAFPAIASLAGLGSASIPTLERFMRTSDRATKERVADALLRIATPECLPLFEQLKATSDSVISGKARAGIMRVRCRALDRTYRPSALEEEDECRLFHLARLAVGDQDVDETRRREAASALVAIGTAAVDTLRPALSSRAHGDGPDGAVHTVAPRAAAILAQIGRPAIPCLIDSLCDENSETWGFAAEALERITGEHFCPDYAKWSVWYLAKRAAIE